MQDRADQAFAAEPQRGPAPTGVWRDFEALAAGELYALLRLRCQVFVVEQQCAFAEIDGADPLALHLLVRLGHDLELAGCLRVFGPGLDNNCARIGRVATATAARRTGLGRWMMQEAFAEIGRRLGPVGMEVSAQVAVEPFYEALGFMRASGVFWEDGIAHCIMRRTAAEPRL